MRDVPSIFGSLPTVPNANGAYCAPGQQTCFAPEWTTSTIFKSNSQRRTTSRFENEFLDDAKGQRTGFKTWYMEHSLSWGHWISDVITIRAEVRFERAYDMPA
jgi:hypothetical protein